MSGTTGTPRIQSYLLTTEFQDGQPAGSISPQDMRDLVVSRQTLAIGSQTGNYTLGLTDAGAVVEINSASATTVTIPTNASVALPVGQLIWVRQMGAGAVTVAGAVGVTLDTRRGYGLATTKIYDTIALNQRSANEWVVRPEVPLGLVQVVQPPFRPENYGAKCDNATNDTAAWTALMSDLTTQTYGDIRVPGFTLCQPGIISLFSYTSLVGIGRENSGVVWSGGGVASSFLVSYNGVSTGSPATFCTVADITLQGGSTTSPLFQTVYGKELHFERIYGTGGDAGFFDATQLWDSRIVDVSVDFASTLTTAGQAVFRFRNSSAASGFGSSVDTTNQVFIERIRCENFTGNALRIEQGTSNSAPPNGIYVRDFKAESNIIVSAPIVYIGAGTTGCSFRDFYLAPANWNSGTTAIPGVQNLGAGGNVFDTFNITQIIASILSDPFQQNASGPDSIRNIFFSSGVGAPTNNTIVNIVGGTQPIQIGPVIPTGVSTPTPILGLGKTVTATATASVTDTNIRVDATSAGFTLTLPLGAQCVGHDLQIVKTTATNTVTIGRTSSDTINGATTQTIVSQYSTMVLRPQPSGGWIILSRQGT